MYYATKVEIDIIEAMLARIKTISNNKAFIYLALVIVRCDTDTLGISHDLALLYYLTMEGGGGGRG